jgi:hypothetical protein
MTTEPITEVAADSNMGVQVSWDEEEVGTWYAGAVQAFEESNLEIEGIVMDWMNNVMAESEATWGQLLEADAERQALA